MIRCPPGLSGLWQIGLALSVQPPKYEAQHQAHQYRGRDRQVEAKVVPLNNDVTGEPADSDLLKPRPQESRGNQNDT